MGQRIVLVCLLALLAVGVDAQQQKSKKSTKKLTKQYVNYVKNKNRDKGKEKLARKKASDPATVTRDSLENEQPKTMQDEYEAFKRKAQRDYENFRDQANVEYAEFVRKAWKEFGAEPPVPKPIEEEVPPVVIPEEDRQEPVKDRPLPIKLEPVTPPAPPMPQPVPVAPIKDIPLPVVEERTVPFEFYGTGMKVRFDEGEHFRLAGVDNNSIADAWVKLSGPAYNNTIRDCIELRIRKQLSDWAYLKMLQKMAEVCLGKTNEATLLMAYIYCQTGYKMRLGKSEGRLFMLYASRHTIFNKAYFKLDGEQFYPLDCEAGPMSICEAGFPQEQPLSLLVSKEQLFAYEKSTERTLKSRDYPAVEVKSYVNKNAIDFYNAYPTSMTGDNVLTRWAMYANAPLGSSEKENLLTQLREKTKDYDQLGTMERLLNWVQTAFVYEYDDKVWGGDRAFFPEETLYYPYCDCEDRSILLSRLVRDLLGLKCILVFYPGHLAMAVHFTDEVQGDYIMLDGEKYIVCDPTYIGAPVGKTMPRMDNASAQVILLE